MNIKTFLKIFLLTFIFYIDCSSARCEWKNNPSIYGANEIIIAKNDCNQFCCCVKDNLEYQKWCINNCSKKNCCNRNGCNNICLKQCENSCSLKRQCEINNNKNCKNISFYNK